MLDKIAEIITEQLNITGIEITEETLKNKTSKTDLIIYKLVMKHLYDYLLSDSVKKIYQKSEN